MSSHKQKIRFLAIVIAILVTLGVSVTWFLVSRMSPFDLFDQSISDAETANWATYINLANGYEIRYPADYTIFQDLDADTEKLIPSGPNSKKIFITDKPSLLFAGEAAALSVEVLGDYVTDFPKWLEDNKIIIPEINYRITGRGYTTISGEQAFRVSASCGLDSPGNLILVNHISKTYLLKFHSQDCLPLSEKIFSTFRFTK